MLKMYNKLKKLCKEKGTNVTNLCEIVTGSSGNLATWKKGYMRSDYLKKSAEYLGVTTDYLLGLDNVQSRKTESISENAQELIEMYTQLSERNQLKIIGYVQRMLEENGKAETINEDVSKIAEADANVLTEPINTN